MRILLPKAYYANIYEIDYTTLYRNGYRGILFDIDNTLVPYDQLVPDAKLVAFFGKLKTMGFSISLLSNNSAKRVRRFNKDLKVLAYHRAQKPRRVTLEKAMKAMGTDKGSTIIVGDQLFTDVWAGNRLGIKTILVMPIQEKEQLITRIKRSTEKRILKAFHEKGIKNNLE
ncbi:YqeG family HAD IIIA-type phosphatase [Anaerotalea alkaliphila]|uniref:YqeG family HAD IIIA-type phosphatase n=1 Tax=Anaerotalea alkaliphila TaxID=2662126 RepID=A0A7X5HTB5_9FIRM|nr:YqeG family HAD IIIA-type phosphatase [Anaerotalea alkaliphila]NDL66249.1 YqeG family HAD IIIA-type phosphatase [Anaerotalea alkaliphila]